MDLSHEEVALLGMQFDIGRDELALWHNPQSALAHIGQGSCDQAAADSLPFQILGHDCVNENDAVTGEFVRGDRDIAVDRQLIALLGLVVPNSGPSHDANLLAARAAGASAGFMRSKSMV
jgi:hypothetical protein